MPSASRSVFCAPPSTPIGLQGKNPIKAQVAQLVEQLAFNQLVLGSSPSLRTFSQLTRLHQGGFFVSKCLAPFTQADWGWRNRVRLHRCPYIAGFIKTLEFQRRNSTSQQRVSGRTQSQSAYHFNPLISNLITDNF